MTSSVTIGLARDVSAAVVRDGVPQAFFRRLYRKGNWAKRVVVTSPWISSFADTPLSLRRFTKYVERKKIPTFIATRPAASAEHQRAIDILSDCPLIEVVTNPHLHAKIYACEAEPPNGFAILGSTNFTQNAQSLYEIGLLVVGSGSGTAVVKELADFGLNYIRTRPETKTISTIDMEKTRREL
jgi:hypothetical protein